MVAAQGLFRLLINSPSTTAITQRKRRRREALVFKLGDNGHVSRLRSDLKVELITFF